MNYRTTMYWIVANGKTRYFDTRGLTRTAFEIVRDTEPTMRVSAYSLHTEISHELIVDMMNSSGEFKHCLLPNSQNAVRFLHHEPTK